MADKKTLGILGGMGPMATVDLFQKVVASTKADRDQDHIHILINNCPSIPDRRTCIIEGTDAAGRAMCEEDYFPSTVKAHLDRGARLLEDEKRYSKDFYNHLCHLDENI